MVYQLLVQTVLLALWHVWTARKEVVVTTWNKARSHCWENVVLGREWPRWEGLEAVHIRNTQVLTWIGKINFLFVAETRDGSNIKILARDDCKIGRLNACSKLVSSVKHWVGWRKKRLQKGKQKATSFEIGKTPSVQKQKYQNNK